MAAGLGFKDFVTGEVLTAADVDGYLMQGIWVFANATARDAAVTSPQEGNFAFLKDTNTTTYYTGSAWTNLDTTGMVNPMTTTGDTIYSSSGSTPARLGIGTAGQVLQVNSGATAPEWATPASGGGMTLLSTTTASGASTTVSGISGSYETLYIVVSGLTVASGTNGLNWSTNNSSAALSYYRIDNATITRNFLQNDMTIDDGSQNPNTNGNNATVWVIYNYSSASMYKQFSLLSIYQGTSSGGRIVPAFGGIASNTAITSFTITPSGPNYNGGTIKVYGVK
jgi:hypothetical protein